jgi:hypothetical protein
MYRATQPIRGGLGSWEPGDPVDVPESIAAAWLAAGIIEDTLAGPAAPAAAPAAAPVTLSDLTFKELSALAAEHGIKVKVGVKKADLITAIEVAEAETEEPTDAEPAAEA